MSSEQVRILHLTIQAPFERAYAFASRPETFARWAAGLADSLHPGDGGWVAQTPAGEALVTFSEPNPHGVLDHRIRIAGKPDIVVPLRMVPNGDGTEVELMLFRQPGMTDMDYDRDAELVMRDLRTLKALLEADE